MSTNLNKTTNKKNNNPPRVNRRNRRRFRRARRIVQAFRRLPKNLAPVKEVKFGPFRNIESAEQMRLRLDQTKMNYYRALLDPEYACVENVPVKFPSPFGLPTKTINVKNTFNLTPSELGTMLLTWRPGFLMTKGAKDKILDWMLEQVLITMPGASLGKNNMIYSQLTVNNSSGLDGESINTSNKFVGMKILDLPVLKYRLVSAKMTVTYNGKAIDEAGSIVSGQYVGGLRPHCALASNVKTAMYTTDNPIDIMIDDAAIESAQFGKFDNVLNLPYGQKEPLLKGKKYSFYYYPMDELAKCFSEVGAYSIGDDQPEAKFLQSGSTCIAGSYTSYQDGITSYWDDGNVSDQYKTNDALSVPVTIPSYIVALQNLASTSSCIEVNIYENYECIFTAEGSMIARSGASYVPDPIEAKNVQMVMNDIVSNNMKATVSQASIAKALQTSLSKIDQTRLLMYGSL